MTQNIVNIKPSILMRIKKVVFMVYINAYLPGVTKRI